MRLRIRLLAIGVAAVAAVSSLGAHPTGPPQVLVVHGTGPVASPDAAELEDAAQLVASSGRNLDEVVASMAGQADFINLISEIEARFPERYADSQWGSTEGAAGYISFVGEVPAQVFELVDATALSVQLRGNARLSQRAAVAQQVRAYRELLGHPEVADAVAVVSPSLAYLELDVQLRPSASVTVEELAARVSSAVGAAPTAAQPSLDVQIDLLPDGVDLGSTEAIRGGMAHGGCTAAFTVRSGSAYGISTAAHCAAVSTYDGVSLRASSSRATVPADGDARWTPTVSATASDAFRYRFSPTAYRNVSSAANPVVGQSICAFGIQTGYQCDSVMRVNACANGLCGVAWTYSEWSVPGDSGGPYFSGTIAHGIHSGETLYNGSYRNVFTRIGAVNLLSAVVIT